MSVPFHLPLGAPFLVDSEAAAAAFRSQVVNGGWGFGGDRVFAAFQSAAGPLPDVWRQVTAPSTGVAWYDFETHLVRLQLMASTIGYLRTVLPPGVPAPQRLLLGPVDWPHEGTSLVVAGGDPIGLLRGPVFVILAQCQDGFHLDPVHLFQALDDLGLWELPVGVRCPLLPLARVPGPFALAGPTRLADGTPYLSVWGGSFDVVIHNPPDPLPASRLSLLSSDTLEVKVHNLAAGAEAVLRFVDLSPATLRTHPNPAGLDLPPGHRWTIVPQVARRATHDDYTPTQGGREASLPLAWRLRATLDGGATLATTLMQDSRDVIRQEYVFHRPPYQRASDLAVPAREFIEPNVPPPFARYFRAPDFANHNYGAGAGGWLVSAAEAYRVAETMRRLFAQQLAQLEVAGTLPAQITQYSVSITSGWRNPERNEAVEGVINSNHQLGRALDLRSAHVTDANKSSATYAAVRAVLHQAMFHAGGEFLRALVAANGGADCAKVEILLERGKKELWVYRAQADGSVSHRRGNKYVDVVGSSPPADAEAAIALASRFASHVHIGWKSPHPDRLLVLPELPPYHEIAPDPGQLFRNLILIADEHPLVPDGDRLPLNHVAESLKLALEAQDPTVPTDLHVVGDAVAFLEHLNAFREPAFKIKRLYSFSHAWPGGLLLTGDDDGAIPYQQPAGSIGPEIHDPEVYDHMNFLYGDGRPREDSEALEDLEPLLPIGPDDLFQFKTHQLRVSNFLFLPREATARLRMTFAEAEGIHLVGCRSTEHDDAIGLSVAQAMADVLQRPVHGAAYYSKVFQRDDEGEWNPLNLTRGDPAPDYANNPVVLVPGAKGGRQYIKYLLTHGFETPDLVPPAGDDLIALYDSTLARCDPKSEGGGGDVED